MRVLLPCVIVLLQLGLSGCGTMPQTAEEFRRMVPDASFGETETFEVDRPFKEVADTFRKMAPKCLDVTIKTTSQSPGSYHVVVANYNPTVIVGKNKAELHLQRIYEKGVAMVYEEPANGHYVMVVDATPVSARKTRIDMYRPSMGVDVLTKAIKGWATGKNVGCPDMTKT